LVVTNENYIHDEVKSRLSSGKLAIIRYRIFCSFLYTVSALRVNYVLKTKTTRNFIICTFHQCYYDEQMKDGVHWSCSTHREDKNSYKSLPGKHGRKRQLMRSRGRYQNNIKMHPKGTECEDIDCIQLIQDRVQWWALAYTAINLWTA
jgi:hypothetical protein